MTTNRAIIQSLSLSLRTKPQLYCGLLILVVAGCIFGAEPEYSELPLFQPLTNALMSRPPASNTPPATRSNFKLESTPAVATNGMKALDDKHKLAIGDRLSFRIVEDEEDPKSLSVTDSGDLEVPYIGRFPAVGRSCKELAIALKSELEKDYYYQATVIVAVDLMTKSRGKVYLVGSVHVPGPQEIPSDEDFTLSKAILRAGGFTDFANKHNVQVTRRGLGGKGDKTFVLDVGEILEKGKIESDMILEPGDLVHISDRAIRLY